MTIPGASLFSNAAVVSRAYNNSKRARPPPGAVLIGTESKAFMAPYEVLDPDAKRGRKRGNDGAADGERGRRTKVV